MSYLNRISQTLHDEHRATIALMERLEGLLARHRRNRLPDTGDRDVARLLAELASSVEQEVERHFDFEEQHLFTYLNDLGDEAIGAHLTQEHSAMRPLGARVAVLAREATAYGFDEARWSEFRQLGGELCERMLAHVQKEEMALLPILEDAMDPDTEARLYQEYVDSM
jgi:hemerythrin-like domain-containing protein